jgi:hypothetical protein
VRSKVAAETTREEKPRLVSPTPGESEEALGLIFAPMVELGEGFRHGAIGAPGYGKTYGLRRVVDAAIERGIVDVVLTHDTKSTHARPDWSGYFCTSVGDCRPDELAKHPHAVFRGDARAGVACDVEDVAQLGQRMLRQESLRVLLNLNELRPALTDGGRGWRAPTVLWFSAEARSIEGCLTWTVQQPKRCPDEIFDQSTTISFHHLDARSANYLGGTLLLDEEMVATLPQLVRGEYCLWQQGIEWNRKVYRW